jgi:1,4-dihydroxy-2-naphthoate octaprenyltransferase
VKKWIGGARPRTLPAAIVPVLVGTACAAGEAKLVWWRAVAAMVAAVAIQVGTNYANDHSDGKRGTDDPSRRTGPVRLVGSGLASARAVLWAAIAAFTVAGVAGLSLAVAVDLRLLLVGVASFAAGWLYTGGPRPYGYAGFGELFVFVFFGLVATVGSTYVQTERITGLSVGAAIPVGLLATALLVVNNLRDIPSDSESGKRTLAVRLGDHRTRIFYVALLVGAVLAVPLVCGIGQRPAGALALVAIPFAQRPVTAVLSGARGPALIPVLVATGRIQLVFGALFGFGIALSA